MSGPKAAPKKMCNVQHVKNNPINSSCYVYFKAMQQTLLMYSKLVCNLPKEPIPSIIPPTVAFALVLSLRDLYVPCISEQNMKEKTGNKPQKCTK